ncbi:MAG: thioredoxin domain-containing protein, partial [Cyanobacteria bacterium PR.023]|nr:thioredoxin domain-containing protein [Cyanobacteria bacterium PR.023]
MYVLTVCLLAGCSGGTVSKSGNSANRLIGQSSPYLKAHAHDPVDWYPWGQEAFAKAKSENKPILLSIGYSACHWCHVMHQESFQDKATAELMNQEFVCIKVDREERPDIDETYMPAVQLISGRGGWPATLFLTPDLKPFFAGTYFPGKEAKGAPSFKQVLTAV